MWDPTQPRHGMVCSYAYRSDYLPPVEWTETKLRHTETWARNTRTQPMPRQPQGGDQICLLGYGAPAIVTDIVRPPTGLSMRERVCDICGLDSPRAPVYDLSCFGMPVRTVLCIQPWVTNHKVGVFMDARALGFPVGF